MALTQADAGEAPVVAISFRDSKGSISMKKTQAEFDIERERERIAYKHLQTKKWKRKTKECDKDTVSACFLHDSDS